MKRFSLKTLLILVTVVGLFFGYSQWRRHRIIQEADEINRQGILTAELPNEFIDMIWQRQPRRGKGPRYGDYIKSTDPGDGRVFWTLPMKRFSLKFLFAASTVLIVFLGFSQARRRAILRQASELSERGAVVEVPHGWIDVVWQRRPSKGRILWEPYRHEEVEQKMRAMGVYRIEFTLDKR